jgi:hypothetical protein
MHVASSPLAVRPYTHARELLMETTFKQLTNFLRDVGADQVAHTSKGYLAHAIGVYNDLKKWGCEEELARVGVFHSIYGTELFQGFTLPVDRRDEVRALIGERAERICYLNCAMDRAHFDAQVPQAEGPYRILDRFTHQEIDVTDEDFQDLCTIHLCDWLEQVARSGSWAYRSKAYKALAERLGGIAADSYAEVFAKAPVN